MADGVSISRVGSIGLIRIERPAKRNAIDSAMAADITKGIRGFDADGSCTGIVLSGAGGTFCAGADLSDPSDTTAEGWTYSDNPSAVMLRTVKDCDTTVVAAVEGWAVGLGLGLVGAATYAVGAAESRYRLPEAGLGFFPLGVVPYLVERMRPGAVVDLALSGRRASLDDAFASGLVTHTAAAGAAEDAAVALLDGLAELPAQVLDDARAFLRTCSSAKGSDEIVQWCEQRMTRGVLAKNSSSAKTQQSAKAQQEGTDLR
ncbi:enoyl-CoA hydratase/isomerase family protein [Streptomyces sp. NPDC006175]|uniref:enoyl-CoA hydratase/isomerase family protein n=1 Tax=unclassified Streptomyces TaxID=2593676 RepID=UPI0033A5E33C